MADQRDELAQVMAQNTGGLTPGDYAVFSKKITDAQGPQALQSWLDKGGIWGQWGGTPPDPDEQYFALKPQMSGSPGEVGWMNSVQPWQQGGQAGGETTYIGQNQQMPGWIGAGGGMRADPSYWGWQGPHQGYAPGSMGDISGFNAGRGSSPRASSTGGLTPSDFAIFSRLVGPQRTQDWLSAGGVQGQFGGGMGGMGGGSVGSGGGSGSVGSGGGGSVAQGGDGGGRGGSGLGAAGNSSGFGPSGSPAGTSIGYGYGPAGTPSADGVNSINSTGAGVIGGFGPSGLNGYGNTMGISGYGSATIGAAADAFGNSTYGAAPGTTSSSPFGGESAEGWGGFGP